MTIVVGIFDNPKDLDETILKLAGQGFEDTVLDESIVAQEMGISRVGADRVQKAPTQGLSRAGGGD